MMKRSRRKFTCGSGFMAVSKRDSHKGVKIEEFNDILRKK